MVNSVLDKRNNLRVQAVALLSATLATSGCGSLTDHARRDLDLSTDASGSLGQHTLIDLITPLKNANDLVILYRHGLGIHTVPDETRTPAWGARPYVQIPIKETPVEAAARLSQISAELRSATKAWRDHRDFIPFNVLSESARETLLGNDILTTADLFCAQLDQIADGLDARAAVLGDEEEIDWPTRTEPGDGKGNLLIEADPSFLRLIYDAHILGGFGVIPWFENSDLLK